MIDLSKRFEFCSKMASEDINNAEIATCANTYAFKTGVNPLPPEQSYKQSSSNHGDKLLTPSPSGQRQECYLEEIFTENQTFDGSNSFEMDDISSRLAGGSLLKKTIMLQDMPTYLVQSTPSSSSPENYVGTSLNIGFGRFVKKATKSAKNTFSPQLQKWFVNFCQPCTVGFSSNIFPSNGLMLRATPIFLDPAFRDQPITRCNYHSASDISGKHILVVASPSIDGIVYDNKGYSVSVPFQQEPGKEILITYLFQCLSTCKQSISRRSFAVKFELVCQGEVLAENVIPTHISTCPGRDRNNQEEKQRGQSYPTKSKNAVRSTPYENCQISRIGQGKKVSGGCQSRNLIGESALLHAINSKIETVTIKITDPNAKQILDYLLTGIKKKQ